MKKFEDYVSPYSNEKPTNETGSNDPKPIETMYKGLRFRSRLEARWAVFLDACGADWEFEPEGYDLPNGMRYLPDFLIHNVRMRGHDSIDVYFEVKGKFSQIDYEKARQFFGGEWDQYGFPVHEIERPTFIVGNIPKENNIEMDMEEQYEASYYNGLFSFVFLDGDEWAAFPCVTETGQFGIVKRLWQRDVAPHMNTAETEKNFRLARTARFEFSEADLAPLEKEVETLRKRAELEEEKRQLINKIQGGH